jgi:regulator of sigma E protease
VNGIYIAIAIVIFGLLILSHEAGHYFMARLMGIRVLEFSVGMGPAIWQKQKGDTLYALRLLPLGGYCQMEGEDDEVQDEHSFGAKPVWARFLVLFSGAAVNLLTGFIVLLIIYSANSGCWTTTVESFRQENAPSAQAGLQEGDTILRLNNLTIHTADDISYFLSRYSEEEVDITVLRNGEKLVIQDVTFPYTEYDKSEITGDARDAGQTVRIYQRDFDLGVVKNNPWLVLRSSFYDSINTAKLIWVSFFDLITGNVPMSDLAGPVGVTTVISDAAQAGWRNLANIVVLIAINLGVLNLLPLPALDGGRIVFLAVEAVLGRPVPPKYEGYVHFTGLVLLMGLFVLITFQDIIRLAVNL